MFGSVLFNLTRITLGGFMLSIVIVTIETSGNNLSLGPNIPRVCVVGFLESC